MNLRLRSLIATLTAAAIVFAFVAVRSNGASAGASLAGQAQRSAEQDPETKKGGQKKKGGKRTGGKGQKKRDKAAQEAQESGAPGTIALMIDETKVLHTLPDLYHGTNLVALFNTTHDSPGTVRAYERSGLKLLRFPGGVPAHYYDWQHPLASGQAKITPEGAHRMAATTGGAVIFQTNTANDKGGKKKGRAGKGGRGGGKKNKTNAGKAAQASESEQRPAADEEPNQGKAGKDRKERKGGKGGGKLSPDDPRLQPKPFDQAEFDAKNRGGTYRFNTSGQHAADWVLDAKRKGMKVAYWEIGNEPEMDAPAEFKKNPDATYAWYNAKFEEQARAIKKADPAAKVMGPASTNTYFWWPQGNLERFLKAHGNRQGTGLVDAISLHWYGEAGKVPWKKGSGAAQNFRPAFEFVQEMIRKYDTRPLPVYITEWNWGGGMDNPSAAKMSCALGNADAIGMFIRSGVSGHTHFCLQKIQDNWGILAMADETKKENSASPTYFALTMAARLGGSVIGTKHDADRKHIFTAYATKSKSGEMQVMLINKSAGEQTVKLQFTSYRPAGKAVQVYTLRGAKGRTQDSVAVYNGVTDPRPAEENLPPPQTIRPGPDFAYKLPAHSMAVLVLPP